MATQTNKVLIGVTGRMDSAVAAYLLKKQGFDVHAVAILFHEQGQATDESLSIPKSIVQYSLSDLAQVKKVFDHLEIPFYAVNAQERYYALVHDPVVANRLMGRFFNAKVAATRLMFDVLFEKANMLGASFVATGHYAKLQKNQRTGESSLFSSHDMENDQSFLLAGLSSKQLANFMLPLSDMRKIEVEKIAKVMAVATEVSKKHQNVFELTGLGAEIEGFIPPSMVKEGEIHNRYDESLIAEHTGVHNFFLGQGSESGLDLRRTGSERELTVVEVRPKSGAILVEDPKRLSFSHVALGRCRFGDGIDSTFPLDVYVQFKETGGRASARLYFKNNSSCVIEFSKQMPGLIPNGSIGVVYSKGSGVSRVLASGEVENCFYLDKGYARSLPRTQAEEDLEFEAPPKNQMGF